MDETNKEGEIMNLEISSFMTLKFFIWPFVYNIFINISAQMCRAHVHLRILFHMVLK